MKTVRKAKKLLSKGYSAQVSDPFRAISQRKGDCVAASLVIKAVSDPDEELKLIRFTQRCAPYTPNQFIYTHYFCTTGDRILHIDGKIVDDSVNTWLHLEAADRKHRAFLRDLYAEHIPALNRTNPTVTAESTLRKQTVTDRFAWVDPEIALARVAPGQTMEELGELAAATLHHVVV